MNQPDIAVGFQTECDDQRQHVIMDDRDVVEIANHMQHLAQLKLRGLIQGVNEGGRQPRVDINRGVRCLSPSCDIGLADRKMAL